MKKVIFLVIFHLINHIALGQWTVIPTAPLPSISDLKFIDENIGFAAAGCILKTQDGGFNWDTVFLSSDALGHLSFPTANTGYAVGTNEAVYKTTDQGKTWVKQITPLLPSIQATIYFSSVSFIDSLTGYIAVSSTNPYIPPGKHYGAILKTTDGGNIWNISYADYYPYESDYCVPLSSIYAIPNTNTVYAVGGILVPPYPASYSIKKIFKSSDAGNNWSDITPSHSSWPETHLYSSVFCLNEGNIYITGSDQYVRINNGILYIDTLLNNDPICYTLRSVWFIDNSRGFITGVNGELLKTSDGGYIWEEESQLTSKDLKTIYFVNDTVGYIGGEGGIILKTTNGGGLVINKEKKKEINVSVFPNPTSGKINILFRDFENEKISICLNNYLGQKVFENIINVNDNSFIQPFDLSYLKKGIYLLTIRNNKNILTKRLIIN